MKFFIAVISVASMLLAGSADAQQAYPNKPIRFIVPYAPGGSGDTTARLVGQKLAESWGQQVIVDFRPGGNTVIGTEALTKAPPDGYTILFITAAHVTVRFLIATPYDPITDFTPVTTLASSEYLLVVHPSVPANNLQEFIALAKSNPGQLNYASSGSGGMAHLTTEMFSMMTGIKMQHIPYKGGGAAVIDLLGGQVQVLFNVPVAQLQHVKSGKLKAIAISGKTRSPNLSQVPTFAEAGVPAFDPKTWFGVLAPRGTPTEIVDKLSTEITKILTMPEVQEKLIGQGLDPFISTPAQFAALMTADMAKYARVIKTANIKLAN